MSPIVVPVVSGPPVCCVPATYLSEIAKNFPFPYATPAQAVIPTECVVGLPGVTTDMGMFGNVFSCHVSPPSVDNKALAESPKTTILPSLETATFPQA